MFSLLEKDRKTFLLVNRYIEHLGRNNCSCVTMDNIVEMDEIKDWLHQACADDHDNKAIMVWIKENGKSFRDYLNTVKLIYLVWYCSHKGDGSMSWDDFCTIGDRINSVKNCCLDSIY